MEAIQLSEIVAKKKSVEPQLLKRSGVTGIDVGYKYVGGRKTQEVAIRVMVEKKKKKDIPESERIPPEIDGVKTDVIERTYFLHQFGNRKKVEDIALQADTGNYSPVKGGI